MSGTALWQRTGHAVRPIESILLLLNPVLRGLLGGLIVGLVCGYVLSVLGDRWAAGHLSVWIALVLAWGIGMTAGPICILWLVTKGAQD
jgi:hypothetical protein